MSTSSLLRLRMLEMFLRAPKTRGGRNVAKWCLVLLSVVFASALAGAQVPGGVLGGSEPDLKTAYVGRNLTCSPSHTLVVPRPLLERAKIKARLDAMSHKGL